MVNYRPDNPPGGGGGGTQVQRGGRTRVTYFTEEGVFLRPPHVRDLVKEGYFFVPGHEVWGVKIPLQSTTEIYAALTPSDSRNDLASESAAATAAAIQAENYNIKS